jgi:hypothetical protein
MGPVKKWLAFATVSLSMLVTAWPAHGQTPRTADKIWVLDSAKVASTTSASMKYGGEFSAGWQSSRTTNPWAFAQCWPVDAAGNKTGSPFWGEWRALQADGSIGVFDFVSADPNTQWPAEGGTCTLSLVSLKSGKQTILATSEAFAVTA